MLNPARPSAHSGPGRFLSRPPVVLQKCSPSGTWGHGDTGDRAPQDSKSQTSVPAGHHRRRPPQGDVARPAPGGRPLTQWPWGPALALQATGGGTWTGPAPAPPPAPPSRAAAAPCVPWVAAPWGVRDEVSHRPQLSPLGQGLSRLTGTSLSSVPEACSAGLEGWGRGGYFLSLSRPPPPAQVPSLAPRGHLTKWAPSFGAAWDPWSGPVSPGGSGPGVFLRSGSRSWE